MDMNIAELLLGWLRLVDDFEQHGAFVLVEPFRSFVDVVIGSLVGPANNHDGYLIVVHAVIVYGWFEHV